MNNSFADGLPSEGNLRHILVQKGFSEDSASDVIRVYKANAELVSGTSGEYNVPQEKTAMTSAVNQPALPPPPAIGAHAWTWTLSIPRSVNAELRIGGDVTKADIVRLRKQIEFLEDSFDETEEAAN